MAKLGTRVDASYVAGDVAPTITCAPANDNLAPEQADAVAIAKHWWGTERYGRPFRLFGYAGTGKTYTLSALTLQLGLAPSEVLYLAPTGKAAAVMRDNGCPARTIHSALYKVASTPEERWRMLGDERKALLYRVNTDADNPAVGQWKARVKEIESKLDDPDAGALRFAFKGMAAVSPTVRVIIIDESSMVEDSIYDDVISLGVPVIFVGDPGQLPPVKSEGVPKAMRGPDVVLSTIHRQAEGSTILVLAEMARDGESIPDGEDDAGCRVVTGPQMEIMRSLESIGLRPADLAQYDQILCWKNATKRTLNYAMREHYGLPKYPTGHPLEKLIATENFWGGDVFIANGSEVKIDRAFEFNTQTSARNADAAIRFGAMVTADGEKVDGQVYVYATPFDDPFENDPYRRKTEYWKAKNMLQLDWAFALTVHKSQGSQWGKVLLIDEYSRSEERNKWLYTGVTRAARELTIVRIGARGAPYYGRRAA